MYKFFLVFISILMMVSCRSKNTPYVDDIHVDVKIVRFDEDLFSDKSPEYLRKKYPKFFDNYCLQVICIGLPDSTNFNRYFQIFRSDSIVNVAENKAGKMISAYGHELNKQLTQMFKYYKYYFPKSEIPEIYSFTSGFGVSMAVGDGVIGIGLDMFLGENEEIYPMLFSLFLIKNMRKERIVCNVANVLANDKFPFDNYTCRLIDKMIYEGKVLYFIKKLCPEITDTDLFGFTADEVEFCKNNEAKMWAELVENKLLYSNNITIISKFTGDAPFTPEFTQNSPGKASLWIGFKIVDKFMNKKHISLAELMNNKNNQKIFLESGYSPKQTGTLY